MRKMKDSGIAWIGKIPQEWDRTNLIRLLRARISDGPHETPLLQERGIPFISVDSLNDSEDIDLTVVKKFISLQDYERYTQKTFIERGDILFTKAATIGKTAIVKETNFMIWSPIAILKSNYEVLDNRYLYSLLNCQQLIQCVVLSGSFNTQVNVGMRELERVFVPLPPLPEQQAIADKLDKVCGEIDKVIAKTKAVVEEYKKLKQAIITEAVTGKKQCVMRNSQCEIKEKWAEKFLFQLFTEVKCKNIGMTETNLLSLSYGKLKRKNINTTEGLLPENFEGYNVIAKGDIVLRLTDLQNDHTSLRVGLAKEKGIITSAYVTLRTRGNDLPDFLYYALHAFDLKKGFYGMGAGVRQNLNWEELKHVILVVPPIPEQQAIVEYLDTKCGAIDEVIAKKQQLITEMENYKKSVIYEYVTGKKEVG